jgi:mercuric transport protein
VLCGTFEEEITMAEREVSLNANGMHCPSCQMLVEMALTKVDGVLSAKVDYAHETAQVTYDDTKTSVDDLVGAIVDAGYDGSAAA